MGSWYITSLASHRDSDSVHVRVYSVRNLGGEKSFSLTIGNELVVLGTVRGWPVAEERGDVDVDGDVDDDDGEEFLGSLDSLLIFLEKGSLYAPGIELLFGCVALKNFILTTLLIGHSHVGSPDDSPDEHRSYANYETFE